MPLSRVLRLAPVVSLFLDSGELQPRICAQNYLTRLNCGCFWIISTSFGPHFEKYLVSCRGYSAFIPPFSPYHEGIWLWFVFRARIPTGQRIYKSRPFIGGISNRSKSVALPINRDDVQPPS